MTDITGGQEKLPFEPSEGTRRRQKAVRDSDRILPYSDLLPDRWREYMDVELGSLWLFGARERGGGHKLDYHGNFIPQIATQLLTRYSKQGDVVLDLFLGSGTTAIEAVNLGRRCIGVEIKPELVEYVKKKIGRPYIDRDVFAFQGDSTRRKTAVKIAQALDQLGVNHVQLAILHPPYWDIISFSEEEADISNEPSLRKFLTKFRRSAKIAYDLLDPGRFAGLIIGDKYTQGELVPLGFLTMDVMIRSGFKLKSIVVKNIEGNEIGKGKDNNLWRYRALAGGFYIFKHEYVIIFQKPK